MSKTSMAEVGLNVAARPLSILSHWAFWIFLLIGTGIAGFQCLMNPNMGADSIRYLVPIQNLFSGKGYTLNGELEWFSSPGYALLSALPYLVIKDLEYAGMLVSALSYLFIVGCSFYIGMRYFNEYVGILSGFFTVLFPVLVNYSYVTVPDVSYTAFLMFSLILCLEMQKQHSKKKLLASSLGGVMGFGCLIRPDILVIAIAVCGMMIIQGIVESRRAGRIIVKPFVSCSLFALVFFLVVLPYMIYLYQITGKFTVSHKLPLVAMGGPYVLTDYTWKNAPDPILHIFNHLNETFNIVNRNVKDLCLLLLISMFFITSPLGLLWLIYPFITGNKVLEYMCGVKRFWQTILIFIIFLCPLAPALLFMIHDRHMTPYLTLMIPLLSCLIVAFLTGVVGILNKKKLSFFLLSVVFLWLVSSVMPMSRMFDVYQWNIVNVLQKRHAHLAHRDAGLWFRDNGKASEQLSIIAPNKTAVILFYASGKHEPKGRPYYFYGLKTFDDVLNKMKNEHIEYLFIDNHYGANNEISMALWKDRGLANKYGLKIVHSEEGLYLIYRLA